MLVSSRKRSSPRELYPDGKGEMRKTGHSIQRTELYTTECGRVDFCIRKEDEGAAVSLISIVMVALSPLLFFSILLSRAEL
jgi:hypothetical protein